MSKSLFNSLKMAQFIEKTNKFRLAKLPKAPKSWISYFRSSLNISQDQLAKKLRLSQPGFRKLEQSELAGTITLASLKRVAAEFDCDLIYAFVPRKNMHAIIKSKALEAAITDLSTIDHSMSLEAQQIGRNKLKSRVKAYADDLIATMDKRLWD